MKASFFTESILYWLARGVSATAQRLPARWAVALGAGAGNLLYHTVGRRKNVALASMRAAFGSSYTPEEYDHILREIFRHLGMTFMEVARIPKMDRAYVEQWITVPPDSRERFQEALARGRGVIILASHFGSWELSSISAALLGYPTLVLARQQGWPRLNGLINQYRESKGCHVVTKGFQVRELIRGLQKGKVIGILADQDGGRNGVLAPFFGRLASTAPGAIALGINAQAPILPIFIVRREGPAHTLVVEEPLTIPAEGDLQDRIQQGIAQYLQVLERYVRRAPHQWLWLHRRWKSSPQRRVVVFSDGKAGHRTQTKAFLGRLTTAWSLKMQSDQRLRGLRKPLVSDQTVEVAFRSRLCRAVAALVASLVPRRYRGGNFWLRLTLTPESYRAICSLHADIAVSCGAATAPVNLLWSWAIGAKAVHITRSRWPSWDRFHLSVIPRHDEVYSTSGSNLLLINGALVPEFPIEPQQVEQWRSRLKIKAARRVGLLLGGNARGRNFEIRQVSDMVEGLLKTAEQMDAELLVTTSRRTPPSLEAWLREKIAHHPRCRLLVLVNGQDPGGLSSPSEAIPCILSLSDVLVVSGDSISMVSEALAQGKPVVSFLTKKGSVLSKHERFLEGNRTTGFSLVEAHEVGRTVGELLRVISSPACGGARDLVLKEEEISRFARDDASRWISRPASLEMTRFLDPVVEFLVKWL